MPNFISRSVTAYLSIDKHVRLISLIFLCPLVEVGILFLLEIGKENPTHPLFLLLVIPVLFFPVILAGVMGLFLSEWIIQIVQNIKRRLIGYVVTLIGIWWSVYSVVYLPTYIFNFLTGK